MKCKIVAAAIAVPILAGCATYAAAGTGHPSGHAKQQPAAPAPLVPPMTQAQQNQECAALAIVKMGEDTYANQVTVMAGQYSVPKHVAAEMIAKVVRQACPGEASILP